MTQKEKEPAMELTWNPHGRRENTVFYLHTGTMSTPPLTHTKYINAIFFFKELEK